MRKMKKSLLMITTGILALSAIASSASASVPVVNNQKVNLAITSTEQVFSVGNTEDSSKVIEAAAAMNSYISLGSDNLLQINTEAKNIVASDVYTTFELGVNRVNAAIQAGSLVVENGTLGLGTSVQSQVNKSTGGAQTDAYAGTYWWGVAVTFSQQETLNQIYTLQQTGVVWGLVAAVSGLIPGGQVASATAAIVSAGAFLISNSMSSNNIGYGVTLNIHWLPFVYFESTPNRS